MLPKVICILLLIQLHNLWASLDVDLFSVKEVERKYFEILLNNSGQLAFKECGPLLQSFDVENGSFNIFEHWSNKGITNKNYNLIHVSKI